METSEPSAPDLQMNKPSNPGKSRAFSLVEVTFAIGIVAFSFVAVFGLVPTGLTTFRKAMNTSVGAQIAQQVINDAQQTDFSRLLQTADGNSIPGTCGAKETRFFDEQGNEIPAVSGQPAASDRTRVIYWVNTRVTTETLVPSDSNAPHRNTRLATVTVQVASNPNSDPLDLDAATFLWTGASRSNPRNRSMIPLLTFTALVSNNE